MTTAACVLECGNQLGEGPVWSEGEGALYWVDILAPAVHRFQPASGRHDHWPMPEHVGSLSIRKKGGLVVALKSGFAAFDPMSGRVEMLAPAEADLPGNRFNDGRCDRRGRFLAGSMSYAGEIGAGTLWRLDADGGAAPVLRGVTISNGLCWSPAGDVMYHADTPTGEIRAHPYDQTTGTPGEPTVLIRTTADGWPDGSITDSEGHIWNAVWDGARVVRYAPDGRIERIVPVPARRVTCCAFGGPDLTTLYITSAWDGLSAAEREAWPQSGHLFALETGIAGLPDPMFVG